MVLIIIQMPISFGLFLMLSKDKLNGTLDYSISFQSRVPSPSPQSRGDQANSSRAEV